MNGFNGIPVTYDYRDVYNNMFEPSTVHVKQTGLSRFFQRYLIQKILSVFEWKGIPETWAKDYFFYTLFVFGFVSIINTDKYGIIPQHCTLTGRDVFYRPTHAVIANPLIKGNPRPRIGKECALVRMQPDYGGAWDIVAYYADQMALCSETLATNLINSKLSYVFAADSQTTADSFKKLYDQVASGEPAIFADRKLFDDEGKPRWDVFAQNLKQNYIASDLLLDMARIENRFDTDIGITNVNITKQSGVSNGEIQANNNATKSKAELWLETMQDGLKIANRLFNLNISVDLRFKEMEDSFYEGGNIIDSGII